MGARLDAGVGETLEGGGECRGEAGGFAQVAHGAAALHVGQGGDGAGVEGVGELAVEGVAGEVDVGEVAGDGAGGADAAVAARVGAKVGDLVAVGERLVVRGLGDVDRGDAERVEREQFAALADAVLVEVAPDAQVGELGVEAAELAVGVAVEVGEGGEAVGGACAVALDRRVAE